MCPLLKVVTKVREDDRDEKIYEKREATSERYLISKEVKECYVYVCFRDREKERGY